MQVSKEEILHVAKLACLKISEDEVENYRQNLEQILNFVQILETVDTEKEEEKISGQNKKNVLRKDEVKEFENKDGLLENAPAKSNGMFTIPKVIN